MKKVVSIRLNNKTFSIEEEACAYLDKAMKGQWNRESLEAQIADRLSQKLHNGKEVITYPDVVDALYQLGFTGFENNNTRSTSSPTKKLYRNINDKVFGGVCSGIADYFDVDSVLVRALFVVGFFLGCVGLFAYLILWIIIPKAPNSK